MDYEKAYNKALERAKKWYNAPNADKIPTYANRIIVEIFPELGESEDEKIKKELTKFLKNASGGFLDTTIQCKTFGKWAAWLEKQGEPTTIDIDKMVLKYSQTRESCTNGLPVNCQIRAYRQGINDTLRLSFNLEKQGEQKVPINDFKAKNWYVSEVDGKIHDMTYNPADNVESKFKVGDWIITKDKNVHKDYSVCKIVEIENNRYHLENGDYLDIDTLEQYDYRLWTIQDAKDGDVLACGDKVTDCPFIFHNLTEKQNPRSYCGVNTLGNFQDNDENGGYWCKSDEVRPATKEQRDTLFKAMTEAGYEWDVEKKELSHQEVTKKCEQDKWSEDDERIVTALMEGFRYHQLFNPKFGEVPNAEIISWIKSLKERLS